MAGGNELHRLICVHNFEQATVVLNSDKGDALAKEPDENGNLPLHSLLMNRNILKKAGASLMVEALVNSYRDGLKTRNNQGNLPIHMAAGVLQYEPFVVKLLADIYPKGLEAKNNAGELPIHIAVRSKNGMEVVMFLGTKYPPGMKEKNKEGDLPIHFAASEASDICLIADMIELYPEGLEKTNKTGELPIHIAMRRCRGIDIVNMLGTRYRQGLLEKNDKGELPIHLAISEYADIGLIRELAEACPEGVKIKDEDGNLPIHRAADLWDGNGKGTEIVKFLADTYPQGLKEENEEGNLPIHVAASYNSSRRDLLRELAERYRGGLRHANGKGNLPIHVAASLEDEYEQSVVLEELVRIDPEGAKLRNGAGELPIHLASRFDRWGSQMKILAKAYPAGMNEKDSHGGGCLPIYAFCVRSRFAKCRSAAVAKMLEICSSGAEAADLSSVENDKRQLEESLSSLKEEKKAVEDSLTSVTEKQKQLEENLAAVEEENLTIKNEKVSLEGKLATTIQIAGEARKSEQAFIALVGQDDDPGDSLETLKNVAQSLKSRLDALKAKAQPNRKPSLAQAVLSSLLVDPEVSKTSLLQVIETLNTELSQVESNYMDAHGVMTESDGEGANTRSLDTSSQVTPEPIAKRPRVSLSQE